MTLTDSSVIALSCHKQCHIDIEQQHQWAYHRERVDLICEMMTWGMTIHVLTWVLCRKKREVTELHQDRWEVGDEFPKALSSIGMIGKAQFL